MWRFEWRLSWRLNCNLKRLMHPTLKDWKLTLKCIFDSSYQDKDCRHDILLLHTLTMKIQIKYYHTNISCYPKCSLTVLTSWRLLHIDYTKTQCSPRNYGEIFNFDKWHKTAKRNKWCRKCTRGLEWKCHIFAQFKLNTIYGINWISILTTYILFL